MIHEFIHQTRIESSPESVFAWHARPGAFERLNPPWDPVEVVERTGGIRDGDRVTIRMKLGPVPIRWTLEHRDYIEGSQFRDVQISGPFTRWAHTHRMEPAGPGASVLEDRIEYELPMGAVGNALGESMTRQRLEKLFDHRHGVTQHDIAAHLRSTGGVMKVLVSGASGLVGSALVPLLTTGGHEVSRLRRGGGTGAADIPWDPRQGLIDPAASEGMDAAVHLAGENIASGRWTAARKSQIRESRILGTRLLCESLARLQKPPKVLVCASAIGYYGDRGDVLLDESSECGRGFLAEVCRDWEAATEPASSHGIRVVHARFGVILSPRGGALAKMLTPFRLGAGGVVGFGRQFMSWIGIDDAVRAILHCLTTAGISGPVNIVAPEAVTNAEFTRVLGRALRRPTVLPMPAFAARLAFGEMADELLLASTRVAPRRLAETGFSFQDASLEPCMRRLLGA